VLVLADLHVNLVTYYEINSLLVLFWILFVFVLGVARFDSISNMIADCRLLYAYLSFTALMYTGLPLMRATCAFWFALSIANIHYHVVMIVMPVWTIVKTTGV